jgi:peroxiredoxin Q/BCP
VTLEIGERAPAFEVETTEGKRSLEQLLTDGPLVLVFYAEDATPLCTTQLRSFRDESETIGALGANVLAVSSDDLDSHERFAEAERLGFPLAVDTALELARRYDVVDDDGHRARRAVFVIASDGTITAVNDHYQPQDMTQFAEVFTALGLEL